MTYSTENCNPHTPTFGILVYTLNIKAHISIMISNDTRNNRLNEAKKFAQSKKEK